MSAIISFIFSALRLGTPLSYAALGGYCSERSGTVNIALEGMMLMGAFTAAATAHATHSPALAVAAGIGGGVILAMLHGFLCIQLGADQIIVLENGIIVGIGNHHELMNQCATYREIVLSQLSPDEAA